MQIKEVDLSNFQKEFISLPYKIYKDDKNWIPNLTKDIKDILDNNKNHKKGIFKKWVVFDNNNNCIGRIAAFVDNNYLNNGDPCKVGGMGFFECIDCFKTSTLLLDTAKNWLQQNGCEAMDGPINFGERNNFWGLLIEGFNEPLYSMNYNPPYYKKLLENYGMQIFYEQYCYNKIIKEWQHNRLQVINERLIQNKDYKVLNLKKNNIEKFANDFCEIYNNAWANHKGNKQLNIKETKNIFNKLKLVIDENITFFVYYKNEPVGFFINLPNLNFYFKSFNGKLNLINKLKFYLKLKLSKNPKIVGLVYGVKTQFQSKGIDALLISALYESLKNLHYKEYEMQWIGEFNTKMCKFVKQLNFNLTRKLATYRIYFNNKYEFNKHPNID